MRPQAEGNIALDLIALYRALGGGWQIRMGARCGDEVCGDVILPGIEVLPSPQEQKNGPRNENLGRSGHSNDGAPRAGDGPRLLPSTSGTRARLLPPVSDPRQ